MEPPEGQMNGPVDTVGSKRLRRPSVRLGDIGDQPFESQVRSRTTNKQYSVDPKNAAGKSSKTRPLINLTATHFHEDDDNLDSVAIGSWKLNDAKSRAPKRVRSNWVPKIDQGDEVDDDFGIENSLKDQSPLHSLENLPVDDRDRRPIRDGVDMSDNDSRGMRRCGEDGVRIWLNSLGLGRYAPVFEVHEVDDEVLPMLTLDDLKDMGINAVGSRRKMYCAIQKLGKGFS